MLPLLKRFFALKLNDYLLTNTPQAQVKKNLENLMTKDLQWLAFV